MLYKAFQNLTNKVRKVIVGVISFDITYLCGVIMLYSCLVGVVYKYWLSNCFYSLGVASKYIRQAAHLRDTTNMKHFLEEI